MNPYQQLRLKAKQRRDESIREARSLYEQAMKRIEQLERGLGREIPRQTVVPEPDARKILHLMKEHMPQDRPFCAEELTLELRKLYPERDIASKTIRAYIHRMLVKGEVRRVARPKGLEVLYAAKACTVTTAPDEAAALIGVCEKVLSEVGPMTMLQLTLAIQDRGTRSELKPNSLMQVLGRTLREHPGRVERGKDGRWRVPSPSPASKP